MAKICCKCSNLTSHFVVEEFYKHVRGPLWFPSLMKRFLVALRTHRHSLALHIQIMAHYLIALLQVYSMKSFICHHANYRVDECWTFLFFVSLAFCAFFGNSETFCDDFLNCFFFSASSLCERHSILK